ncbi:MAG: rhodanese-like domain-containing protein [Croceivirga sp.]
MKTFSIIPVILFYSYLGLAQKSIEKTLESFNSGSVPYITVQALKTETTAILLDTRKKEEYDVSHLEKAHWVGFKSFNLTRIKEQIPDTLTPLIVYCSIGVRSEQIGEKLKAAGYPNVKNLYGGIFQWKIEGEKVVDSLNQSTERVHAFSKHWGKLLTNAEKVYSSKTDFD